MELKNNITYLNTLYFLCVNIAIIFTQCLYSFADIGEREISVNVFCAAFMLAISAIHLCFFYVNIKSNTIEAPQVFWSFIIAVALFLLFSVYPTLLVFITRSQNYISICMIGITNLLATVFLSIAHLQRKKRRVLYYLTALYGMAMLAFGLIGGTANFFIPVIRTA